MHKLIEKIQRVKVYDLYHILLFVISIIPSLLFKIYLTILNKDLWLIAESKYEARDNGYDLFKYIRDNYPDKDVYYALDIKSPDYKKVSTYGNIISYSTLKHWIYYLAANKNISTHKSGKPNAAVCYVLEVYGILNNVRVFLQHGITMNNLEWLYYDNTKISLFICGAEPEYQYIKEVYGYPKENLVYAGFCRFDYLHNVKINKKQIVFMPTWRNWLVYNTDESKKYEENNSFSDTDYFKKIQGILSNKELQNILDKNDLTFYFYPHRDVQHLMDNFEINHNRIKLVGAKDIEIKTLLQESTLMITDYSSVSMDFAYMKKPVIYYQFDSENFFTGQYKPGYFSYLNDGFGPVCYDEKNVIRELEKYVDNNFKMKKEDLERHKDFFKLYDTNNCERNYKAIARL